MVLNIQKATAFFLLSCVMLFSEAACSNGENSRQESGSEKVSSEISVQQSVQESMTAKNRDVYILFTSDVHCGIDKGFGYAGVQQMRDILEKQGYETILVDDGDAIQGEEVGAKDQGETIISLMNALSYDVAVPGNNEFFYGSERFLELTQKADFPYVSCNFTCSGNTVLKPYVIKEAAGMKIAFVGVTTPITLYISNPENFKDKNGEYVYGFMEDETGQMVYRAVQKAVDSARSEGADIVYLVGHLGNEKMASPWNCDDVIANTNGIDAMLDGHSHDTKQTVLKNKDGKDVTRSACGTKLNAIGYSHISSDKKIVNTNIWKWEDKKNDPDFSDIHNDISEKVKEAINAETVS